MNLENIINDVKACLDSYNWPYNEDRIKQVVSEWLKAKQGINNLLSKHPLWNEDAMAIVFDYDSIRNVDRDKFYEAKKRLRNIYERH